MAEQLRTRIWRIVPNNNSCFDLNLPIYLACPKCERYIEKGVDKRHKFTCQQPWLDKWGLHRQKLYVQKYNDVRAHLNMLRNGDKLVDKYAYGCSLSSESETGGSSPPSSPEHDQAAPASPRPRILRVVVGCEVMDEESITSGSNDCYSPLTEPAQQIDTTATIDKKKDGLQSYMSL